jgi:SSS family transporter
MTILAVFGALDWSIIAAYLVVMAIVGFLAARKKTTAEDYFLAERSMPIWAIAMSVVATSLSVATFLGAPQQSFKGDLTYLSLNIGGFLAVFVVAAIFIPRFYQAGTVTIYGYIDQRFGQTARLAVSCMFLLGRLLASGVRLFYAAIPVCLIIFNKAEPGKPFETTPRQLIFAICVIGVIGTAYIIAGGIRAVIWTDAIQICITVGAVLLSIFVLLKAIPLPLSQIIHTLLNSPGPYNDSGSKLRIIDFSLNPTHKFTFWTALIGATFLNPAAYGVDQDMAQRMLTAKNSWRGGLSLIASQFLSIFVVSLFMIVGLLLYMYYNRPDIMGTAGPKDIPGTAAKEIYPQFLLNHLPTGISGLAMAGMFAIAQSSLSSAINAMASSAVADVYWPIRRRLGLHVDLSHGAKAPQLAVAGTAIILILFAIVAVFVYNPTQSLLDFALGVMTFAYSGMLGVFLTALLTKRGNSTTVLLALVTGVYVTTLLQPAILGWIGSHIFHRTFVLAEFWWMPIGTTLSFLVCASGRAKAHHVIAITRGFEAISSH